MSIIQTFERDNAIELINRAATEDKTALRMQLDNDIQAFLNSGKEIIDCEKITIQQGLDYAASITPKQIAAFRRECGIDKSTIATWEYSPAHRRFVARLGGFELGHYMHPLAAMEAIRISVARMKKTRSTYTRKKNPVELGLVSADEIIGTTNLTIKQPLIRMTQCQWNRGRIKGLIPKPKAKIGRRWYWDKNEILEYAKTHSYTRHQKPKVNSHE